MPSFTFVTAIIDTKSQCREETLQFKMDQIHILLNTLVGQIQIFADRGCHEILQNKYKDCANITFILFDYPTQSWIYKASLPYMNRLPITRNLAKDTFEHLVWTHLKVEFLQRAIEICKNSKNSIFAWMDPHICHLFHEPLSHSVNYLNYLSMQKFTKGPFIALPSCWDKQTLDSINFNTVCWRFCGNFMIGDAASINNLHILYEQFYPTLLKEKNTMTWDVNMWAHLESAGILNFIPYKANHDASIVRIPTSLYSQNLSDSMTALVKYDYPEVPGFFPSSASYIEGTQKTLVTRYVNYKIGPDGRYTVFHPSGQLQTRNLLSILSDDYATIHDSRFLDESAIGIPTYTEGARYVGLEDVRIFKSGFVASSAAYTQDHSIRIVQGVICDGKFVSGVVLQPPNGIYTPCEKNWIPLPKKDCYIYRWHPYEIICADKNGNTTTVSSKVISNTLFEKVRGSTVPVWSDTDLCYICVVHWTEVQIINGTLEYYHMLVKLNATYEVMSWSQPFHFFKGLKPLKLLELQRSVGFMNLEIGIQYCLGFVLINPTTYGFWFSENDGNPKFMRSYSSQFSFVELDGKCVE